MIQEASDMYVEKTNNKSCSCNGALKCGGYCEECQLGLQGLQKCWCLKAAVCELLRTRMVTEPAQLLTGYNDKDITYIKFHVHGKDSILPKNIIGYDENLLNLYWFRDVMNCGKDTLVVNEKSFYSRELQNLKDFFKGKVFRFVQINIAVSDKFSERIPGLCKPGFVATRVVWFTTKHCLLENQHKFRKN